MKQNTYPKDRKSGSAGMPRPISYAVFCLKKELTCGFGLWVTSADTVRYFVDHRDRRPRPQNCGARSFFLRIRPPPRSTLFPYTPLFRSNFDACGDPGAFLFTARQPDADRAVTHPLRSEERFSRNAETDIVWRLLLVT